MRKQAGATLVHSLAHRSSHCPHAGRELLRLAPLPQPHDQLCLGKVPRVRQRVVETSRPGIFVQETTRHRKSLKQLKWMLQATLISVRATQPKHSPAVVTLSRVWILRSRSSSVKRRLPLTHKLREVALSTRLGSALQTQTPLAPTSILFMGKLVSEARQFVTAAVKRPHRNISNYSPTVVVVTRPTSTIRL